MTLSDQRSSHPRRRLESIARHFSTAAARRMSTTSSSDNAGPITFETTPPPKLSEIEYVQTAACLIIGEGILEQCTRRPFSSDETSWCSYRR